MTADFWVLNLEGESTLNEAERAVCPQVEAAVALIVWQGRLLATYNDNWGTFSLPIARVQTRGPGEHGVVTRHAGSFEAASRRAAEECLHHLVADRPEPVLELKEFLASGRDRVVKRYDVRVFRDDLKEPGAPRGQGSTWSWPEELLKMNDEWLSPTARHILRELCDAGYDFARGA